MASVHETIVSTIRSTANTVNPNGRFIYGDDVFQSIDYPNSSKASDIDPKALISLFTFDWTSTKESDSNFNSSQLSMGFLRSSDPQDKAEDVESIINEMSELAESFEDLLKNAAKPINYTLSSIVYGQTRGVFNGYYTGVLSSFTFSPIKPC